MLLEVNSRLNSGVAVLDLIGRISSGAETDSLRSHMLEAFQHSSHFIVLNCEQLSYADSTALGELLSAYSSIVRRGGVVKLLRPDKRLMRLLEITHLVKVFDIHHDEKTAVAGFNTASAAHSQQAIDAFLKDA
jgi:anti-sigma B factor antagonist